MLHRPRLDSRQQKPLVRFTVEPFRTGGLNIRPIPFCGLCRLTCLFLHDIDDLLDEQFWGDMLDTFPFELQVSVLCDHAGLLRLRAAGAGLLRGGREGLVVRSPLLLPW